MYHLTSRICKHKQNKKQIIIQSEKDKLCMISLICEIYIYVYIYKLIATQSRTVIARMPGPGEGEGRWGDVGQLAQSWSYIG